MDNSLPGGQISRVKALNFESIGGGLLNHGMAELDDGCFAQLQTR